MNVHVAAPPPNPDLKRRLLPELAEQIKEWFKDLNGRAIAVRSQSVRAADVTGTPEIRVTCPMSNTFVSWITTPPMGDGRAPK